MSIHDYIDAKKRSESESGVLESKQTFYLCQSSPSYVGVLIIHGFSANPLDTKVAADYLHQNAGVDVLSICLPGHGSQPEAMKPYTFHDWLDAAKDAYRLMQETYDQVVLYGISMGALLALHCAEMKAPSGLICLGNAISLSDWRMRLGGPFGNLVPILAKALLRLEYVDNELTDDTKDIIYPKIPLSAAVQLYKLIQDTRPRLAHVNCPLLVLHSQEDQVARPKAAKIVYNGVSSEHKQLLWTHGHHTFLTAYDPTQKHILEAMSEFCQNPSRYFANLT